MRTIITIVAVAIQVMCFASSGWAQTYTRIVSPVAGQIVPGPDVKVQFVAGGAALGTGGWNLHFKLDDEPFQVKYNANRAHVFKNVMPGSHTVRMYMADEQHRAIPGTLSIVSFSVAHYDGANTVRPGQPLLTWNLPQGEYLGVDAQDVTLDFMVNNVALSPGGYQVAYYVDGRRYFVQDGNHRRHIKDLAPGLHRIRIELQDCYGDIVPGTFNSGERVIAISPYNTKSSAPAEPGAYARSPRIASIPGSMTAGGPRPVMRPPVPLTEEQRSKQLGLTVDKAGEVVRLDGREPERVSLGTAQSGSVDVYVPGAPEPRERQEALPTESSLNTLEEVPASTTSEFQVRQGGEPDISPQDLEEPPSANLQSGSVIVNPEEDDEDDAVIEVTASEEQQTTRSSTRKRADGSTTKVERTTETLRLADRPDMRESAKETTRTVRVKDSKTTESKSKSDDEKSTGSKAKSKSNDTKSTASNSQANDSKSTGSDDRRAQSERRRERRDRAARRAENGDLQRDSNTTDSKKSEGEPPSPDLQ